MRSTRRPHTHTCTRKKEREKYGSTPTHIIYGCRVFPDFSLCVEYIYSHSHTLKCVALSAHEAGILCSEFPSISIFLLHITKRGGVFNFMLLLTFAKQGKPSKRTVLLLCKKRYDVATTWLSPFFLVLKLIIYYKCTLIQIFTARILQWFKYFRMFV